jgi:hypothetical protein
VVDPRWIHEDDQTSESEDNAASCIAAAAAAWISKVDIEPMIDQELVRKVTDPNA